MRRIDTCETPIFDRLMSWDMTQNEFYLQNTEPLTTYRPTIHCYNLSYELWFTLLWHNSVKNSREGDTEVN